MRVRFALIGVVALFISGCGVVSVNDNSNKSAGPRGGIMKTTTRGEEWNQIGALYAVGGESKKIGNLTSNFLKLDPSDPNTLYMGTDRGIYYSYNRGQAWSQTLAGKGVVNDLSIDPNAPCTLYAVVHNGVYKSKDCSRSWERIHFSSLKNEFFVSIMIDAEDSNIIYVGASTGTLLRSLNAGLSWDVLHFFSKSSVNRLLQQASGSNIMYAVTKNNIQRSDDDGATWTVMNKLLAQKADGSPHETKQGDQLSLRTVAGSAKFNDLQIDETQEEGLIYANSYGIFRLIDGQEWREIDILNKPAGQRVRAVAVDLTDPKKLYFATKGAFYRSDDGGLNWTIRPLKSAGIPRQLTISPLAEDEFYIGFQLVPKK